MMNTLASSISDNVYNQMLSLPPGVDIGVGTYIIGKPEYVLTPGSNIIIHETPPGFDFITETAFFNAPEGVTLALAKATGDRLNPNKRKIVPLPLFAPGTSTPETLGQSVFFNLNVYEQSYLEWNVYNPTDEDITVQLITKGVLFRIGDYE